MAARKEQAEKLDFLTRLRIRELILMGLITITAVLANLPRDYVEQTLGMSSETLLAVLATMFDGATDPTLGAHFPPGSRYRIGATGS